MRLDFVSSVLRASTPKGNTELRKILVRNFLLFIYYNSLPVYVSHIKNIIEFYGMFSLLN